MNFESLETIDEIRAYVRSLYRLQTETGQITRRTPKLALAAAEPGPLIERAIEIAGTDGITDANLRRGLTPPIAKKRFEEAIWRMESAGLIVRSLERRPDARGAMRNQVVWRSESLASPLS